MDEPNRGISGSDEPIWTQNTTTDKNTTTDRDLSWQKVMNDVLANDPFKGYPPTWHRRPMYYLRDGSPIISDDPADPSGVLKWAKLFDGQDRRVAQTITPYGERLSTVFLGLDHNYSPKGPPILFETMLFAPESDELRRAQLERLKKVSTFFYKEGTVMELEDFPEEKYIAKHFPHDQLQERYATEAQAKAGHQKLKLQCLIPPRWRRFLLYTIGRDELWD
jgi:hypothetical protein